VALELPVRLEVIVDGATRTVEVERLEGDRYRVRIGDAERVVVATRLGDGLLSLGVDGKTWDTHVARTDDGYDVDVAGIRHEVEVRDPRRAIVRSGASSGAVKTTMPGRVVRLLVAEGATVELGQALVVVEAMKMENELKAPRTGTVRRIAAAAGTFVEAGALLLEIEAT
jgi:biotin carboxyl carrier protein